MPDSQSPSARKEGQPTTFTDDHAFVVFPVMVPDNVRNVNHLPDPASQMAEPTNPASQNTITSTTRSTPGRLLDCIREQLNGQESSNGSTEVISESCSTGIEKPCNPVRRALCSCCSLKSPDIF